MFTSINNTQQPQTSPIGSYLYPFREQVNTGNDDKIVMTTTNLAQQNGVYNQATLLMIRLQDHFLISAGLLNQHHQDKLSRAIANRRYIKPEHRGQLPIFPNHNSQTNNRQLQINQNFSEPYNQTNQNHCDNTKQYNQFGPTNNLFAKNQLPGQNNFMLNQPQNQAMTCFKPDLQQNMFLKNQNPINPINPINSINPINPINPIQTNNLIPQQSQQLQQLQQLQHQSSTNLKNGNQAPQLQITPITHQQYPNTMQPQQQVLNNQQIQLQVNQQSAGPTQPKVPIQNIQQGQPQGVLTELNYQSQVSQYQQLQQEMAVVQQVPLYQQDGNTHFIQTYIDYVKQLATNYEIEEEDKDLHLLKPMKQYPSRISENSGISLTYPRRDLKPYPIKELKRNQKSTRLSQGIRLLEYPPQFQDSFQNKMNKTQTSIQYKIVVILMDSLQQLGINDIQIKYPTTVLKVKEQILEYLIKHQIIRTNNIQQYLQLSTIYFNNAQDPLKEQQTVQNKDMQMFKFVLKQCISPQCSNNNLIVKPSLCKLRQYTEEQLKCVPNFTIQLNESRIRWESCVDLRYINFDEILETDPHLELYNINKISEYRIPAWGIKLNSKRYIQQKLSEEMLQQGVGIDHNLIKRYLIHHCESLNVIFGHYDHDSSCFEYEVDIK